MRGRLVVLLLAGAGCGPLTFTTEVKGEGVVPGSALGGVLTALPALGALTSLDFSANQDFQNNKVTRDAVQSAKVLQLTLRIVAPNDQDFAFLSSIQFVAQSDAGGETLFAQKNDIAALGLKAPNPTLTLDVQNVDLAEHVRAPSMSIVMRGSGHQPPQDTRVEAAVKLQISAKVP